MNHNYLIAALGGLVMTLSGCSSQPVSNQELPTSAAESDLAYLIGPGDVLQIFVWRNPELTVTVPVRPDGKITTPLVEDAIASGKTASQLAREMERRLALYVKDPVVTVITQKFVGRYSEQIRVVGQAAEPRSLSYNANMTLLDVIIEVGGLTEFADGNNARIVRTLNGKQHQVTVRLDDLIKRGDISANVRMLPGDILIIPESWF